MRERCDGLCRIWLFCRHGHRNGVGGGKKEVVVNEQFTTTMSEQISTSGTYVLRIETAGGALVGQFVVQ